MFGLSWPEIHGALTHFPVALLITAFVFDAGALLFHKPAGRNVSFWLLVTAVVAAVPTLATGWVTGNQLFAVPAHPPPIFIQHRLFAITTAVLAIVLLLWRVSLRDGLKGGALQASVLLALVIAGTAGFTGFLGGRMVFGTESAAQTARETSFADNSHKQNIPGSPKAVVPAVDAGLAQSGQKLFQEFHCQSCHKMNGKGGMTGPDLTRESQRHADTAWQIAHLTNPQKVHPGSIMPAYADLPPDQLKALASFLSTRK